MKQTTELEKLNRTIERVARAELRLETKRKVVNAKQALLNKELKKQANYKELVSTLEDLKKPLKSVKGKYKILLPKTNKKLNVVRQEILMGDIHYLYGDKDDRRMGKMFGDILNGLKHNYRGGIVRLCFLGDDIEGELHLNSIDKHQEQNTVNQVIGVTQHYVTFIKAVAEMIGAENVEMVFVPESNHGQLRLHGMTRGQQPRNDVGYIILNGMLNHKDFPEIKVWQTSHKFIGVVETDDTFYMHGDKQYMNKADKVRLVLGRDKNIVMAHWHSMKISQHGNVYLIVVPKMTIAHETYAQEAGYANGIAGALLVDVGTRQMNGWTFLEVN